ncbi:hypothetical protein G6N74_15785 [Mesorhizobium sp. CGMCC 1.15528]|uniref:YcxB family protein n=1 Tax=Mesorhizobium zhangyense TaxID=1776730 RepID=A0A7C9VE21_9HYPH|nr:hypothetical protein [Mesorhizobium zhangyense]NGN42530.1 hypothetical protein [Mesorhizobium zhangyense]
MQLGYTPDYSEMITAGGIAARRILSPWQRYWCWPYYILLGLVAYGLGVTAGNFFRPEIGTHYANVLMICVMAVIYVAGSIIGVRLGRSLTARWLRKNKPERPVQFSVEPDGLQWRQSGTYTHLGFADIDRMVVTGDLVGFISAGNICYVPHRAFESVEQTKMLVRTTFERMTEQARQLSLKDVALRSMIAA